MPRARRMFESGKFYEVCIRTSKDLPFASNELINLLIVSAFARASRENRFKICYSLWMGNHAHIGGVINDNLWEFTKFYGELQKNLTEIIKRLTGKSHLRMWEARPMVAQILDFDEAKERIIYAYLNPAKANLVESIADYPGVSSWSDFKVACSSLTNSHPDFEVKHTVPRIHLPTIPRLSSLTPRKNEIREIITAIREDENIQSQVLTISPNSWFKAFDISEPESIHRINNEILREVNLRQQELSNKRETGVLGRESLINQQICKRHKPKEKKRKVFFLTCYCEMAQNYFEKFLHFSGVCSRLLSKIASGNVPDDWPRNAFRPPLPNLG